MTTQVELDNLRRKWEASLEEILVEMMGVTTDENIPFITPDNLLLTSFEDAMKVLEAAVNPAIKKTYTLRKPSNGN